MGWVPEAGTDDAAIHDDVAGEIAAVTEKTTPVAADLLLIEDSAASNAKKRVQVGNLPSGGGGGGITSPADLTGLVLWLDADAITGLVDTDPVTTWPDGSTAANDATQATAANKPTYRTNILNSKPVVRFDGTDDVLVTGALISHTETSVFIVANRTAGTGYQGLYVTDKVGCYSRLTSSGEWGAFIGGQMRGQITLLGTHKVLSHLFATDAVMVSMRMNGLDTFAAEGSHDTRTATTIGAGDVSGTQPHQGDIAELIVYNRTLQPSEIRQVEEYLLDKWGL